ncbi:ubiquitin fusion degradation 1 [Euphorbia peplus]|nr:ubiquitin fusion degradation 1 [Euphorbia peplus]
MEPIDDKISIPNNDDLNEPLTNEDDATIDHSTSDNQEQHSGYEPLSSEYDTTIDHSAYDNEEQHSGYNEDDTTIDHSAYDNEEQHSGYDSLDEDMYDSAIYDDFEQQNSSEIYNTTPPYFESFYACYSLSIVNKPHLEQGDQIIMPESNLHKLLSLNIQFPMLFEIRNIAKERVSHCGVSEFTANEGTVLLPSWMMKNLHLEEGESVSLKYVDILKGTYVKLQPHSVDFLEIRNPKSVLEDCLCRKFFCLTVGDTIKINYNNKDLLVDVVDAKPAFAICIVDTDCEVDFAPPLDYKEPVKDVKEVCEEVKSSGSVPFSGVGRRLDGRPVLSSSVGENSQVVEVKRMATESENRPTKSMFGSSKAQDKIETVEKKEFQPFTGKKYTLSG